MDPIVMSAVSANKEQQNRDESMDTEMRISENTILCEMPSSNSGKRKFQLSWMKDLEWLQYEEGMARCLVCNMFSNLCDRNSKVVKGFAGPFKLETFKKHGRSMPHIRCEEARKARGNPQNMPLAKCMKTMNEKTFKHLHALFSASYYIAKNNRPYSDLEGLVGLLSKFDVTDSDQYANEKQCQEFISHIAAVLRDQLLEELKDAKYVSILVDGSTDKSDEEEIVIYVRYVSDKKIKETFLCLVPLENATSEGYLEAIEKELSQLGLQKWLSGKYLVGIGTDGAAAMIGVHNGLVTKISKKLDHLITVHCVAHKLHLCVLQSVRNVKIIEDVDSILRKLYKFYQNSPKRLRELKKISEVLECEISKLKYLHNIRWVASKIEALNAFVKDWKAIIVHLESISERKGEEGCVAKGLLKKIKDFRFLLTVHFLIDYLNVFKCLSLLFQKPNVLLSQIRLYVDKALNSLEQMKSTSSEMEEKFVSKVTIRGIYQDMQLSGVSHKSFDSDKANLLNGGIQFLNERFTQHQGEIQKATGIFDTFSWPCGKKLENFGDLEILSLTKHFKEHLAVDEDRVSGVLHEWYEFKVLGKGLCLSELLERTLSTSDRFPILSNLLQIVATLPVSTASCERGFSTMNIIKNKLRTNLSVKNVNDLMMITLNGPSVQEFNPEKSVDLWYFSAKTKRHC